MNTWKLTVNLTYEIDNISKFDHVLLESSHTKNNKSTYDWERLDASMKNAWNNYVYRTSTKQVMACSPKKKKSTKQVIPISFFTFLKFVSPFWSLFFNLFLLVNQNQSLFDLIMKWHIEKVMFSLI